MTQNSRSTARREAWSAHTSKLGKMKIFGGACSQAAEKLGRPWGLWALMPMKHSPAQEEAYLCSGKMEEEHW